MYSFLHAEPVRCCKNYSSLFDAGDSTNLFTSLFTERDFLCVCRESSRSFISVILALSLRFDPAGLAQLESRLLQSVLGVSDDRRDEEVLQLLLLLLLLLRHAEKPARVMRSHTRRW